MTLPNSGQLPFLPGMQHLGALFATNSQAATSNIPSGSQFKPSDSPSVSGPIFTLPLNPNQSSRGVLEHAAAAISLNAYNLMFQHHMKLLQQQQGGQNFAAERKILEQREATNRMGKQIQSSQVKPPKKGKVDEVLNQMLNHPPTSQICLCLGLIEKG